MSECDTSPIECAGAVCVKSEEGRTQVLLVRRGQSPRAGEWSIPGGRIEPGESPQSAALRELQEETGVKGRLGPLIALINVTFEGKAYRLHDYAVRWHTGEPSAGSDASQARWFTLGEARALKMWPKTLEVVEMAAAQLG